MQEDAKKEELIDVGEKEGAEINLDQDNEQTEEAVAEEKVEETKQEETPVEEKAVGEKKDDKEDELKAYSDGVQKRIAKLTRKMREAERQREKLLVSLNMLKKKETNYKVVSLNLISLMYLNLKTELRQTWTLQDKL